MTVHTTRKTQRRAAPQGRASAVLSACAILLLWPVPEAAAADERDTTPPAASQPLSGWEVRIGAYLHNAFFRRENGSVDANFEVRTPKLLGPSGDAWRNFLTPRIYGGATISFSGFTSLGYAGFSWEVNVTERTFLDFGVGAAFHDGNTGTTRHPSANRAELGCSPLIHSGSSVGYRVTENWSVMASFEHVSNGGTCGRNQGLTNVGARVAYRF